MGENRGTLGNMEQAERGGAIRRRMDDLGVGLNEVAEVAGVARNSVHNATRGAASERTYRRVEIALDKLEGTPDVVAVVPGGIVEFEVTGDFDVKVIAKGPIENVDEIRAQVTRLVRDIQNARARKQS